MEFFEGNAVFALLLMRRIRRLRRQRSMWVHPLTNARLYHGQYYTIMTELRNDNEKFFNFFRMSQNTFNELLSVIKNYIQRQDTNMRDSIQPEQRLAITVR